MVVRAGDRNRPVELCAQPRIKNGGANGVLRNKNTRLRPPTHIQIRQLDPDCTVANWTLGAKLNVYGGGDSLREILGCMDRERRYEAPALRSELCGDSWRQGRQSPLFETKYRDVAGKFHEATA